MSGEQTSKVWLVWTRDLRGTTSLRIICSSRAEAEWHQKLVLSDPAIVRSHIEDREIDVLYDHNEVMW